MGYDHQRIKSNARLFYKNNTGNSILSILIFFGMIVAIGMALRIFITIFSFIFVFAGRAAAYSDAGTAVVSFMTSIVFIAGGLAMAVAEFPLIIGLMGWYRSSIYRQTSLGDILTPYKPPQLWSNIGTGVLITVFTYLWTLLFIIPGIIKALSYSQALYIKGENPNISASRAIELSKIMMNGHKWDIFYLQLSFIGWNILSSLTFGILGIVYVFPYYYAAHAFAYEEIKADAAARGIIDIREINPNFYSGEIYPQ